MAFSSHPYRTTQRARGRVDLITQQLPVLGGMGERGFLLLSSVAKVGVSPFHLPSALPTTLSIRRSTFSTHGGVCRLNRDQIRSPDLIDLEYADLNLKEKVAETVTFPSFPSLCNEGSFGCRENPLYADK